MSSRLIFLLISLIVAWVLAFNSGRDLAFNLAYLLTGVVALSYLWARMSLRAVGLRRFTRTQRSQVGQFAEEDAANSPTEHAEHVRQRGRGARPAEARLYGPEKKTERIHADGSYSDDAGAEEQNYVAG